MKTPNTEDQWSKATVELADIIMHIMLAVEAKNVEEILPKIKELKNKTER
jgi:hypothetical protein